MTHDPYQTFPFAAYPVVTNPVLGNPFNSPFTAMQTSAINPATAFNPVASQQLGNQGIQGFQGWPNYGGVGLQNPLLTAAMQNPLLAYAIQLQNPLLNPILAQLNSPFGPQSGYQPYSQFQQPYSQFQQPYHQQQQHHQQQQQMGQILAALGQQVSPFAQSPGAQFNPQLAPQSWVGQGLPGQVGQIGQIGGGYGQANPLLLQLAARALQGASPWAAF